ncbi:unnamed protein product [Adineta steineri]|uniref:Uncharacterized protein n=1 Tax=Adineta steineri TaxID=433720 RepID=A0A818S7C2_9BILA|nr:unnamed protein product [Adineta steineri]
MNSPQLSSPLDKSLNINFTDRVNSLTNQLESLSKTNSSVQQIFHIVPIIHRFLQKSLQSHQKLSDEYHDLTNTIQQTISICTQYIHDRYDHENELLFLKNKISQIIGQIGYTQYCLEQYWTMIYSLEQEIERLQILLSNPQLLQINRHKFETLQETQKIKLDRFIKENENIKLLINKRKDSIQTTQKQIEIDIKELQKLKSILYNGEVEQKHVQSHWLQIEKQTSHLHINAEKTKNMENEYQNRMKTTKIQYNQVGKQLNSLSETYDQTNKKLIAIQTNETNIKQEIDNVKNEITAEQTCILTYRDQIQNLRHHTHKLELEKRHTHQLIKFEEHTNSILERKQVLYKHNQLKLQDRVKNLLRQLTDINKRNQMNQHIISTNILHLDDQQYKITSIKIALKKIIHLNNNLEKFLHENRFIRLNEQEKLRSIKQFSFQKRQQLIIHNKRLHTLSINERRLVTNTIRNSLEIIRLNNIFHDFNNTEKHFQLNVREKKTELMNHEKHRTSLNHNLRNNDNKIYFLTKKTQLIENELQNKIDHFRLLHSKFHKQKHDRMILSNQKQICNYSYQQKSRKLNELYKKQDQFEKLSDNEINHIIDKIEENEQLKVNIHNIKQQILDMISTNKRRTDEYSLLQEKIRLSQQLNDMITRQQYSYHRNHFIHQVLDLQQENNRLSKNLQDLQKKSIITISSNYNKLVKKDDLYQSISHQPLIVRNNQMHNKIDKALEDYPTFVNQLMKAIYQCVHWREKLLWINQLYFTKIEQIHQQMRFMSTNNDMISRYKMNSEIKQCKAMKAEARLQACNTFFDVNAEIELSNLVI